MPQTSPTTSGHSQFAFPWFLRKARWTLAGDYAGLDAALGPRGQGHSQGARPRASTAAAGIPVRAEYFVHPLILNTYRTFYCSPPPRAGFGEIDSGTIFSTLTLRCTATGGASKGPQQYTNGNAESTASFRGSLRGSPG